MNRLALLLLILLPDSGVRTQSTDLRPSENLVVHGIPPIPASIVEGVGRYTEFRSASFSSWHPTNLEMLIITRFGDVPQVHHVKTPGGARTQLTFYPDRVTGAWFNPKRDDYFLFSKDVGGGEWYQLYRYDRSSGNVVLLTDGKSRNQMGPWSSSGDRIVYGSTRRNGKDIDFYIMNPLEPAGERMLAQLDRGESWRPVSWSPDDRKILASEYVSANESYLWVFDAVTGSRALLTPRTGSGAVAYGGAVFSKDGKGVYTTTDFDSEFKRLVYIDLETRQHMVLTPDVRWDVSEFSLSPDGNLIVYTTNEDGIEKMHLLSTKTRTNVPLPELPSGLISGVRWHNNNQVIGFTFGSARSTGDAYSLNLKTGKVERWTFSETGGLNAEDFSEPRLVKWTSFDGRTISGFLYMPPKKFEGKRPVIINIHGGPESQARPGFQGRNNYYLNELGVALLFPNVRGSSGYGKTFLMLDNGFKREESYRDIGALLDWIKTQPDLDGDRIMVTGGSYGGHMTFAVATYYSDRIRCALPVVGISNLVTFLERTEAYRRDLRRAEYGDERNPEMRAYLNRIAPVNNADKIRKPIFIVQGLNDPRVPAHEAEQMIEVLKKNTIPYWYLLAKDEGHGFAKKKNQDFQFYATILFIKEYLLK